MEILNQPFSGHFGDRLIEMLDSKKYRSLNMIVAFAKNSGFLRIKDALERFRDRGGEINAYVGVDLGGTSYEALIGLHLAVDSLYVVHAETSQTFHSKIYNFIGEHESLANVGSHNLTGGGLWTNFESSAFLSAARFGKSEPDFQTAIDDYIKNLTNLGDSFQKIENRDQIDHLLEHEYVLKEVIQHVRRNESESSELEKELSKLFGPGAPASLPRVSRKIPTVSERAIPNLDENPVLWYATQKMTGGSGNQFDLSKTSFVVEGDPSGTPYEIADKKFMRGTVEFFGVDSSAEKETTTITINFDGRDYEGNIIRMHQNKRSNGTWRLQLQGADSTGRQINDAFRSKGGSDYLKQTIVTFMRISDRYYSMSVFSERNVDRFKKASQLWGHNGPTATGRPIGII